MRALSFRLLAAAILAAGAALGIGLACGTRAAESKPTTTSGAAHVPLEIDDELADLEWEHPADRAGAGTLRSSAVEATDPQASVGPERDARPVEEPVPGVTVRGHVFDDLGRPVQHARVELRGWIRSSKPGGDRRDVQRARALSDRHGAFELEMAGRSEFELGVAQAGFLPLKLELGELAPGARIDGLTSRLDRGLSIAGRAFHPDSSSARYAHVRVDRDQVRGEAGRVLRGQADADGRFEISGLDAGRYTVGVEVYTAPPRSAAGDAATVRSRKHRASARDVVAGTHDLELRVEPEFVVSGIVVDTGGKPVERFALEARPCGSTAPIASGTGRFRSFADSTGRFELDGLASGCWSLVVRTKDGVRSPPRTVELAGDLVDLRLVIERSRTLSGVVLEPDGTGAARAELTATIPHGRDPKLDGLPRTIEVVADREGRFEIDGLRAPHGTEVTLGFQSADRKRRGSVRFTLAPGVDEDSLVLQLPEPVGPSEGSAPPRPFGGRRVGSRPLRAP